MRVPPRGPKTPGSFSLTEGSRYIFSEHAAGFSEGTGYFLIHTSEAARRQKKNPPTHT
ncbi:hypothetical protein HMPREF0742_01027 [Rothia aeria F0184]|uniref:Uncharacterized protein n=1 Tax=Rothia aeria F0184 TaxID=888019 RepID=U7V5E6_9MICC|nr:hypothetical protein HMPREF0742_01027 [Rothia aeria F0184]